MMYRDPTFDLAQIQTTMRLLYLDNLSRSNEIKGKVAGRGVTISVESVICDNCDKAEHISRNYLMSAKSNTAGYIKQNNSKKEIPGVKTGPGSGGATRQKWCSVHKSMTHNDADCYQQQRPRPQKGSAFTTARRPNPSC